ncbi:MAG: hypothetical protein MI717_00440 [Spirochaetales bacterium]|nr:hypothetical protein [Spirochaetales bacterium]
MAVLYNEWDDELVAMEPFQEQVNREPDVLVTSGTIGEGPHELDLPRLMYA